MLATWGPSASCTVGLARQSPQDSSRRSAHWAFAAVWGIACLHQGVPVVRHARILSWASAVLDLLLLTVGGVCLAITVSFTVRSGTPATRPRRSAPLRLPLQAATRLHTFCGIPMRFSPAPACSTRSRYPSCSATAAGIHRALIPDTAETPTMKSTKKVEVALGDSRYSQGRRRADVLTSARKAWSQRQWLRSPRLSDAPRFCDEHHLCPGGRAAQT